MAKKYKKIIYDLRTFGTWGKNGDEKVQELRAEQELLYPDKADEFDEILGLAKEAGNLLEQCRKLGAQEHHHPGKAAKELCEKFKLDCQTVSANELLDYVKNHLQKTGFKFLQKKAEKQVRIGKAATARYLADRKRNKTGKKKKKTVQPRSHGSSSQLNMIQQPVTPQRKPPATPVSMHGNDIRSLAPQEKWTVLIDETGNDFEWTAQNRSDKKKELGRMISLLFPDNKPLPSLEKGWHAVDKSNEEIDDAVQTILSSENCGVFGLSVKSIHLTPGERWAQLIQAVIEWIVRLLPLYPNNKLSTLSVLVEQRGKYQAGQNWQLMADVIKHSLANTMPERAKKIELHIKTIGKEGHPCNGYVDALAFTWSQSSAWSQDRLRDSGLSGSCLLSIDANLLLQNWNTMLIGANLDDETWSMLLNSRDAVSPASIVTSLLDNLGKECKADDNLWRRYLNYTQAHATGKAVNLRGLAGQISWLDRYKPQGFFFPAPLQLAWLTVKLANSNHHGETEIGWLKNLEKLKDKLYMEDAPLVCHADLHRSVQATNRFDFAGASAPLSDWQECDPAIPGLRYWGQIQSSLGQHAAFLGKNSEAIAYFDKALDAFNKLSDGGVKDRLQTGTYKAIVMMDDTSTQNKEVLNYLLKLLGDDKDIREDFARSNAAQDKYLHHLVLRYLVFRGQPQIEAVYLSEKDNWKCEQGHPWPLIQAYRALLLYPQDQKAALSKMVDGATLAFAAGQGPTVHFIGACLRTICHCWGDEWPEYNEVLDEIKKSLPKAHERIEAVRKFIEKKPVNSERELLRTALPFNFR